MHCACKVKLEQKILISRIDQLDINLLSLRSEILWTRKTPAVSPFFIKIGFQLGNQHNVNRSVMRKNLDS